MAGRAGFRPGSGNCSDSPHSHGWAWSVCTVVPVARIGMRFLRIRVTVAPAALRLSFVLALVFLAACGGNRNAVPNNTTNPDRFLFERGTTALSERKWADA